MQQFEVIWNEAIGIWSDGGWAMWAIATVALVMFLMGMHVLLELRARRVDVPETVWRRWIERPRERTGSIGRVLDRIVGRGDTPSDQDIVANVEQLRLVETVPIERDLRVMKVCVSAAPLVGLLGTVTGMLSTFGALADGGGGEKTMALVSRGISEALITTETGLVVALPGVFFQYRMSRRFQQYKAFLAHVETVCTQTVHRWKRAQGRLLHRRAAQHQIARTLQGRLQQQVPDQGLDRRLHESLR